MMDALPQLIDFVLHVDRHLREFVVAYGHWVYALLFAIVFVETGVVVMPFLPGDSLLFVVGALCGAGLMHIAPSMALLFVAAVLGDQLNYSVGRVVGHRVWHWEHSRWFNRRAFEQAHAFYERYGGVTIIAARFMPFLRTFVPFVAGVAEMTRHKFTLYNFVGGALWVASLVGAGYLFGNLPWVQANFSVIVWLMIIVPGLLAFFGAWQARRKALAEEQAAAEPAQ
jgi:membrane-associated protein